MTTFPEILTKKPWIFKKLFFSQLGPFRCVACFFGHLFSLCPFQERAFNLSKGDAYVNQSISCTPRQSGRFFPFSEKKSTLIFALSRRQAKRKKESCLFKAISSSKRREAADSWHVVRDFLGHALWTVTALGWTKCHRYPCVTGWPKIHHLYRLTLAGVWKLKMNSMSFSGPIVHLLLFCCKIWKFQAV